MISDHRRGRNSRHVLVVLCPDSPTKAASGNSSFSTVSSSGASSCSATSAERTTAWGGRRLCEVSHLHQGIVLFILFSNVSGGSAKPPTCIRGAAGWPSPSGWVQPEGECHLRCFRTPRWDRDSKTIADVEARRGERVGGRTEKKAGLGGKSDEYLSYANRL